MSKIEIGLGGRTAGANVSRAFLAASSVAGALALIACSDDESGPGRPNGGTGGVGAAAGVSGSGGSSGSGGDSGGSAGTGGSVGSYWDTLQWAACLKVVREICERSVACAPADAAWKYGDSDQVNRCVAAEREKYCFSVSQPHQSSDSLGWLACAAAEAPKLDCAEAFYFPFYHLSVTCGGYPNGTQPIGGLCVHNAQCSTKSCETSKTHLGCSQCIDSIAVGGDCSQGKTCASGARCVADVCVKELPENAPCTPLTACGPGLACREISGTESQCRKYARLGDPCDASLKQPCAPYFPLLSYSSTVVCEAGVCTWKPAAPFKRAVGEICDDVAIIDICGQEYAAADARCDKDSGKCVATVGEGEDCDSARPCDRGNGAAYCIQGKCKLAPVDVPNCYK